MARGTPRRVKSRTEPRTTCGDLILSDRAGFGKAGNGREEGRAALFPLFVENRGSDVNGVYFVMKVCCKLCGCKNAKICMWGPNSGTNSGQIPLYTPTTGIPLDGMQRSASKMNISLVGFHADTDLCRICRKHLFCTRLGAILRLSHSKTGSNYILCFETFLKKNQRFKTTQTYFSDFSSIFTLREDTSGPRSTAERSQRLESHVSTNGNLEMSIPRSLAKIAHVKNATSTRETWLSTMYGPLWAFLSKYSSTTRQLRMVSSKDFLCRGNVLFNSEQVVVGSG